jgi:MEMO1 family protein
VGAVHISPFSGNWYPGRAAELESLVEELFARSRERTGPGLLPRPSGFVVPHAGLMYSGAVAASAYRHLQAHRPARVVVLGFSHRGGPHAVAVPDIQEFATPLGRVVVDRAAVDALCERPPFLRVPEGSVCDHSVEIQLPLLQHAVPGTPVVPLYVGALGAADRQAAADALADLLSDGSVALASSDFTHYGPDFHYVPFPPDDAVATRLRALDGSSIEAAGSLDVDLFRACLAETHATVCGTAPIALWLSTVSRLSGEEKFQTVLDYQTSGEILNDYRHSVSYAALGYFPADSFTLAPADCDLLLASACATLARLRETGERVPLLPERIPPALTRRAAVFVSLHQGERLLGCVGAHSERQPLAEAIPEMTLAAALDDPRFSGILEVPGEIQIEISVLSPMKAVRDAAAFCVRQHGAFLRHGSHAALLLPQVAANRDWTAREFLQALSQKAGLGPHGCQDPESQLAIFRAQVFR